MRVRPILLGALAVTVAAQLAVPISMIARHERALRQGEAFKLRTAPVDPVDLFRGRFVALGFEETSAPAIPGVELEPGSEVYAELETGPSGFASFTRLSLEPPAGDPYLKLRTRYQDEGRVYLVLPFRRYYMPEDLAPRAETAYREHSRRGGEGEAHVVLRVHRGLGVIEDLYIGDRSVRRYLEETG